MNINLIKKQVDEFVNSSPKKGFEIDYLEKSNEILQLYDKAVAISEESGDEEKITEIFNKIKKLM